MPGQRLEPVSLYDIELAHKRLKQVIDSTPIISLETLNSIIGQKVNVKAECLLPVGSFKLRGAYNKIASLTVEERKGGIITASAGNHAMGVSLASKWLEASATVVVPETAPSTKKERCKSLGAIVVEKGDTYDEAYAEARKLEIKDNLTYVHPVADTEVVAGQGTVGLEIIAQMPHVKQIIVPLGGGGLVSGIAIAVKTINPSIKVIAVQPEGSPAYYRSYKENKNVELDSVNTIADGLAVKKIEPYLMDFIRKWVDDIVLVKEETIKQAIRTMLIHGKLVVEGAGAVTLGALMEGLVESNEETVIISSGANIDEQKLLNIMNG